MSVTAFLVGYAIATGTPTPSQVRNPAPACYVVVDNIGINASLITKVEQQTYHTGFITYIYTGAGAATTVKSSDKDLYHPTSIFREINRACGQHPASTSR